MGEDVGEGVIVGISEGVNVGVVCSLGEVVEHAARTGMKKINKNTLRISSPVNHESMMK